MDDPHNGRSVDQCDTDDLNKLSSHERNQEKAKETTLEECGGVGVSMEVEDDPQLASSRNQKEQRIAEQLKADLPQLKALMPKECFNSAERLVDKSPINPNPNPLHRILAFILLGFHKVLGWLCCSCFGTKATVKVFSVSTGQTCGADQVILDQVKNSPVVEITDNLQECDIIIVFCPIKSRVGSDVVAAMKNDSVSSGSKPVILVVMHHTLDQDYSTDVRRWSESIEKVVLDVQVLLHETQQGLLRCSRNDEAVKLIQEELKKHSKDQAGPQQQQR